MKIFSWHEDFQALMWMHDSRLELIRQIVIPFQIAVIDLRLEHLWVIYPGDQKYALDGKITAILLEEMLQLAQAGLTT